MNNRLSRIVSLLIMVVFIGVKSHAQIRDTAMSNDFFKEGVEKMENNNFESAIESFNKAIRYNNQHYLAFERRGYCRMKLENQKERHKDRDYTLAITDYSAALMALDDILDLTKDYGKKRELKKEKAPILINRGWAKIQIDKRKYYKLAIDDFNKAYKFDNSLIHLYTGRAYAYHKRKDFQKEILDYRHIIREASDPDSKVRDKIDLKYIYYNMGQAYIDWNNDTQRACESFKKALDLGYSKAKEKVEANCEF